MMNLQSLDRQLIGATPYFKAVNPGLKGLIRPSMIGRATKVALVALANRKNIIRLYKREDPAVILGETIGAKIIGKAISPVSSRVKRAHIYNTRAHYDYRRKNGLGGRSWYDGASRQKLIVVFHDANKAGPHIDVHVGRLSVIYKVPQTIYGQISYNSEGVLTQNSQKLLMNHVRQQISEQQNVPQNLDHSVSNARANWTFGDVDGTEYGSGFTRQIICESEVDIYKAHHDGPIEMYAPALNSHRPLYMFKLFAGDKNKKVPIVVFGVKKHNPPEFKDRLHLKMVDEDVAIVMADMSTATAKYDGASAYFVITKKGTTVWSPRTSVRTGERIEYTHKVNGIASLTNDETIVGMGELLYVKKGEYISAAQVGGILNSNAVVPKGYKPEIRMYRIDKVGRQDVSTLPFWENRTIATKVADTHNYLKTVDLMHPSVAHQLNYEGFVVIPEGGSVIDGYKVKWMQDAEDWRIDTIALFNTEKGSVGGVVHCTSLESGKAFNLGPGQIGSHELNRLMMANPDEYVGRTIKVESRRGHEGRASKMVDFHLDK